MTSEVVRGPGRLGLATREPDPHDARAVRLGGGQAGGESGGGGPVPVDGGGGAGQRTSV